MWIRNSEEIRIVIYTQTDLAFDLSTIILDTCMSWLSLSQAPIPYTIACQNLKGNIGLVCYTMFLTLQLL